MAASQGTNSPTLSAVFCSPPPAVRSQHPPKSSQIWGLTRAAVSRRWKTAATKPTCLDNRMYPQAQCSWPMGMWFWGPQHWFCIGRPGLGRDLEQVICLLCNTKAEIFLTNCSVTESNPLLIKACGYKGISTCNFHQCECVRPRL